MTAVISLDDFNDLGYSTCIDTEVIEESGCIALSTAVDVGMGILAAW